MHNIIFRLLVGGLVFAGLVFLAASYFVEQTQKEVLAGITIEIIEQEKTLASLAEVTDRDGADAVVEALIRDCSSTNRLRFEDLLNNLGSLNSTELIEIEQLFDACARFFSQRKAAMVSRLDREYEVYSGLVDILKIVDDSIAVTKYKVDDWKKLVDLEKNRSTVFTAQADIQLKIIERLQAGEAVNSEAITSLLSEAQNVNQEAVVIDRQIDVLRAKLLDI